MPQIFWDASALVKRYIEEVGSDTVAALLAAPDVGGTVVTYLTYTETASILRRRFNAGAFGQAAFALAREALHRDLFLADDVEFLTFTDADFLVSVTLIDQHNLNSTDAVILTVYLEYAARQEANEMRSILVAADQRLLRAADAEGLRTVNPEAVSPADIPEILAAL